MFTFTRCFPHPEDKVRTESTATQQRFYDDQRQYPPGAYRQESLAWRGGAWRTLTAHERALVHGMPLSVIDAIAPALPAPARHQVQCSAVGNGYHLPSLMLAVVILLQLGPSLAWGTAEAWTPAMALPRFQLSDPEEAGLRQRFSGSIFDPYRYKKHTTLLLAKELVADMEDQLKPLDLPSAVFLEVEQELQAVDLASLQLFYIWATERGHTALEAGPSWRPQREREH